MTEKEFTGSAAAVQGLAHWTLAWRLPMAAEEKGVNSPN